MSEPTSPRDELVTLLSEHETQPGFGRCSCGVIYGNAPAAQHTHLADVLLAAGYRKIPRVLFMGDSIVRGETTSEHTIADPDEVRRIAADIAERDRELLDRLRDGDGRDE